MLLLGLLLGAGAGALLLTLSAKSYTADTSVLVAQVTGGTVATTTTGSAQTPVNMDTESQLAASALVATRVQALLHTTTTVADLQSALTVTVPTNSSILDLAFTASSPSAAQQASHAFAVAYLAQRSDTAQQQIAATVAGLRAQLAQSQAQLKTLTAQSAALKAGSPEAASADAQRNVLTAQVSGLLAQLGPLQATTPAPGRIVSDATLPTSASSPVPALDLSGGVVAGTLLALGLAVLLDARDRRLRRPSDVTRLVGLPLLADVPGASSGPDQADELSRKAFDRLRTVLIGLNGTVVVQVVDPEDRNAGSTVAVQLAHSVVRVGGKAVLVVAHAGSAVPGSTGVEAGPGLVQVLRGEITLERAVVHPPDLQGVGVLPAGPDAEDLDGLLQSPHLAAVLADLVAAGTVVVETSGLSGSAGAQAVTVHSDIVVLVGERGRTDSRSITTDTDVAQALGTPVAGIVLVGSGPRARPGGRSDRSAAAPQPTPVR